MTHYDQESLSITIYQPLCVATIVYLFRKIIYLTFASSVIRLLKYQDNKAPKVLKPRWKSNKTSQAIYIQYELDQCILNGYFRRMQTSLNIPKEINMLCFKYYHNNPDIDLTQQQCDAILQFIDDHLIKPRAQFYPVHQYMKHNLAIDVSSLNFQEFRDYFSSIKIFNRYKRFFLEDLTVLFVTSMFVIYGVYVMLFKYDLLINHANQWVYFDNSYIQQYDNLIKWYFISIIGIKIALIVIIVQGHCRYSQRVTIQLIALALYISTWMSGMIRTGAIAIFLNESTAVFLITSRTLTRNDFTKGGTFFAIIFFISWFIFKLLLFCQKLVIEISYYGSTKLSLYSFIVYCFIYIQQVLHIYWFWLIWNVCKRTFGFYKQQKMD